jgi:hypothetical protein
MRTCSAMARRSISLLVVALLAFAGARHLIGQHQLAAFRERVAQSMNACRTAPPGRWIPYQTEKRPRHE